LSVVVFGYRMTARPYSVMSFVRKTMIVKRGFKCNGKFRREAWPCQE
jgi:hypothetical protein